MTPPPLPIPDSKAAAADGDRRLELDDLAVYAPEYRITVSGHELDPTTKGDVLDLSVVLEKDKPAGFTVNINDWDDQHMSTKYSSTTVFDPGNQLTVEIGYAERLVRVVSGQVSSLSVRFPDSGPPSLTVGGQDSLWLIGQRKPAANERKQWSDVADWQVVQEIAARLDLGVKVDKKGPIQRQIVIKNQDYASFLVERAAKLDFEVYIGPAPDPRQQKQTLYFVERQDGRQGTEPRNFDFTWGRNLMSFTPRLSTSLQVRTVTVRAWDPATKKAIVVTADKSSLPASAAGPDGGTSQATPHAQDLIVDRTFKTVDEAREFAVAELRRRSNAFLKGTGKAVGLPDLRPGAIATIGGIGPRFKGTYQVTKVTHQLGSGGFTTEFEVERDNQGRPIAAPTTGAGQ